MARQKRTAPRTKQVKKSSTTSGKPVSAQASGKTTLSQHGDLRSAVLRQPSLAGDLGSVVGNRELAGLVSSNAAQGAPSVQRILGGAGALLAAQALETRRFIDQTMADNEQLQALTAEIDHLAANLPKKNSYHEEKGKPRDDLVTSIGTIRGKISSTVLPGQLGVSEGIARAIRHRYFIRLAKLAPFYTQQANADILASKDSSASDRTCNITTVAMTLEGLGKTTENFDGNDTLMNNIVSFLKLGTTDAKSLRLPDFLQVLAIYLQMKRGNSIGKLNALFLSDSKAFHKVMIEGAIKAADMILNSGNFHKFTSQFGVSAESRNLDLKPALAVFGEYYRPFEKDLVKFAKKKLDKKKVSKSEIEGLRDQFTTQRKASYMKKAQRAGKDLEKSEALIQQLDESIGASKQEMEDAKAEQTTLDGEIGELKERQSGLKDQIEIEADKKARKALKQEQTEVSTSLGEKKKRRKKLERDIGKLQKALDAMGKDRSAAFTEKAELMLKQSASEAVGGEQAEEETNVEEAVPIEVYQHAVIPLMQEILGSGDQVIVNLYNHFVKLQAISDQSIIIHDPGGTSRDNKVLGWEEARKNGYFKRYTVVRG